MSENEKDTDKKVDEESEAKKVETTEAEDTESKESEAVDEAEGDEDEGADEAEEAADEAEDDADEAEDEDDDDGDDEAEEAADEGDDEAEEAGDEDDEADEAEDEPAAPARASGNGNPDDGERSWEPAPTDGELWGLMAEYETPGELIEAAKEVRDAGFTQWDCYSPFPVHGIDPAMGIKMTILPLIVFGGGIAGLCLGLGLQWWTNAFDWPWIISGKPFWSIPANIPIGFETTVLLSAFTAFLGMWAFNKLPKPWHPLFRNDRFGKATDDGFFLAIEAADAKFDEAKTRALLENAGASIVEPVHLDPDPATKKMPRPVVAFIIMSACLALVPIAMIAKARTSKSSKPHWHIIPDMDFQWKYKSQQASDLFDDERASRPNVPGTVARGELRADDHFYRGILDGKWADRLPPASFFPTVYQDAQALVERGRDRFTIYCRPCHGSDGHGNGMVAQRAKSVPRGPKWVPPSDLTSDVVIKQPHGQIYNTISNGIRNMPSYSAQIPEADRWAIVLYVRALQRAQNAKPDDVPADQRNKLR
jgi:mono/diheme cytochrome c family protein